MTTHRVQRIAVDALVRRNLDTESSVEADLRGKIMQFAQDNSATVLKIMSPHMIELGLCLDPIVERYRAQLPAEADPRDWFAMRMEADVTTAFESRAADPNSSSP